MKDNQWPCKTEEKMLTLVLFFRLLENLIRLRREQSSGLCAREDVCICIRGEKGRGNLFATENLTEIKQMNGFSRYNCTPTSDECLF